MKVGGDFSKFSLQELFRFEAEQQVTELANGLLKLETTPSDKSVLEALMRAAHSTKGAARIVQLQPVVDIAHCMENAFVAALDGRLMLSTDAIDGLLEATDVILELARLDGSGDAWLSLHQSDLQKLIAKLSSLEKSSTELTPSVTQVFESNLPTHKEEDSTGQAFSGAKQKKSSAQLDRFMALSSQLLVENRWVNSHLRGMHRVKRVATNMAARVEKLRLLLQDFPLPEMALMQLNELQSKANQTNALLTISVTEYDTFERRSGRLTDLLHREVMAARMRPFSDCLTQLPRLSRDVARLLGKSAVLTTSGHQTLLDRDIVAKLDIPLKHLINNALDHGIELPGEREKSGKSPTGLITIAAFQRKGSVYISIEDDGRGIDLAQLRTKIITRGLITDTLASDMSDAEVTDFLFLPGFSTREVITEVSGRGVGLDVVRDMVQELQGTVKAESQLGKGMRITLQLPLTMAIVPTLLVEIAGEPFGIALARVDQVLREEQKYSTHLEGGVCWQQGGQKIQLVPGFALLGLANTLDHSQKMMSVVVLNDGDNAYGVVVDRLVGERDLVVQALPAQLGRVKEISSGAIMEDGTPVLMIDVDDMLLACKKATLMGLPQFSLGTSAKSRKRILVVDDSLTVREIQRKVLEAEGYYVDTAVDGVDAWNTLRAAAFDLMISDVDMPRINGIELVRMLKRDEGLCNLPVMIVSYKDRDEDRFCGLEAGADYYLGKGNFQDHALRDAVYNLIGASSS